MAVLFYRTNLGGGGLGGGGLGGGGDGEGGGGLFSNGNQKCNFSKIRSTTPPSHHSKCQRFRLKV